MVTVVLVDGGGDVWLHVGYPDPSALPLLSHEGPGRNRFDDPLGQYAVRYVAKQLTGCLVETMARFRHHEGAEARLRAIAHVDDDTRQAGETDYPDPTLGLLAWLDAQQVGRITHDDRAGTHGGRWLPDVTNAELLVALDKHPLVRATLEESPLGTPLSPVRLDEAVIRLGGPLGRPITQAVSRAVREWLPDARGLAYDSCIDDRERCWAPSAPSG